MRGRPWPRSSPASPPLRSATATANCGSRPATSTTWSPPAPSTTTRSTKGYSRPPGAAGCWPRSRAKPTAPWPRAARSAWPTPVAHDSPPAPNAPSPRRPRLLGRPASEPRRGGDGHARRRLSGRPNLTRRGGRVPPPSRARAHPTTHRKEFLDGQPPHPRPPRAGRRGPGARPRRLVPPSRHRPPGHRAPPGQVLT
jgi:hypothetical protein